MAFFMATLVISLLNIEGPFTERGISYLPWYYYDVTRVFGSDTYDVIFSQTEIFNPNYRKELASIIFDET